MHDMREIRNPFSVRTPEGMPAADVVGLFVDVFTNFPKIADQGHCFLHGPRGSGKSMMFRYLQPDCQVLARRCRPDELQFWGVYIPVKNVGITEMLRLDGRHASALLNEHFLTMHVTENVFDSLARAKLDESGRDEFTRFLLEYLLPLLADRGADVGRATTRVRASQSLEECLNVAKDIAVAQRRSVTDYAQKLTLSLPDEVPPPYTGALCDYLGFLHPVLSEMKKRRFMPAQPVYLLVDDADCLSLTQTRVLNSWVSCRMSADVSIKASTQMRYKTYRTVAGSLIESPHDFQHVNMLTLYTASPKETYRDRVHSIVQKRLERCQISATPEEFFPDDAEQEAQIKQIAARYIADWEQSGAGYRPGDDAYRYARPDYIKSLAGSHKSTPTYSYAGFSQLVHISSAIVRNFLEAAALMFSETVARQPDEGVCCIPHGIQSDVVKRLSDEKISVGLDAVADDQAEEAPPSEDIQKLRNLVLACGSTFRAILVSGRSERRVFSIAISGQLDPDVRRILRLGVQLGFFHEGWIGNKEGTGRTPRFVLTRLLAPFFRLDPTSFAGYLFVTSGNLRAALYNPGHLLRSLDSLDVAEPEQLPLEMSDERE